MTHLNVFDTELDQQGFALLHLVYESANTVLDLGLQLFVVELHVFKISGCFLSRLVQLLLCLLLQVVQLGSGPFSHQRSDFRVVV